MKEAQPTRSEIEELKRDRQRDATYIAELEAELEQVRQLRESDALEAKIEWANAIGRAEASESREKRAREALEELIETVENSDIAHPCIDAVLARARCALEGE